MIDLRGIIHKFTVRRVDGSDYPGGKHYGCRYFVLDLDHDEGAGPALVAYAKFHQADRPTLSQDLLNTKLGNGRQVKSYNGEE